MDNDKSTESFNAGLFLKAVLASAALALTGVGLTACNTTEGVGRDIEAAGDAIADTADDASD